MPHFILKNYATFQFFATCPAQLNSIQTFQVKQGPSFRPGLRPPSLYRHYQLPWSCSASNLCRLILKAFVYGVLLPVQFLDYDVCYHLESLFFSLDNRSLGNLCVNAGQHCYFRGRVVSYATSTATSHSLINSHCIALYLMPTCPLERVCLHTVPPEGEVSLFPNSFPNMAIIKRSLLSNAWLRSSAFLS